MRKKIHNYTSNLELTSLLIRIKNYRNGLKVQNTNLKNHQIDKYLKWYEAISSHKFADICLKKKERVSEKLKQKIITLSEQCPSNSEAYNRFGYIILLMIKHILSKPQFSGYTYKDDFCSDAVYKILKYLNNFDHTKISSNTGKTVNAFSYISQIIHMSILFVINTRKEEAINIANQSKLNLTDTQIKHNILITEKEKKYPAEKIEKQIFISSENANEILDEIRNCILKNDDKVKNGVISKLILRFKDGIEFTADQYNKLKELKKDYEYISFGNRYFL